MLSMFLLDHCPQKYWITNGAIHANYMVVFAQLMVDGVNNGIHGVLAQIRDAEGNNMPGYHGNACVVTIATHV